MDIDKTLNEIENHIYQIQVLMNSIRGHNCKEELKRYREDSKWKYTFFFERHGYDYHLVHRWFNVIERCKATVPEFISQEDDVCYWANNYGVKSHELTRVMRSLVIYSMMGWFK